MKITITKGFNGFISFNEGWWKEHKPKKPSNAPQDVLKPPSTLTPTNPDESVLKLSQREWERETGLDEKDDDEIRQMCKEIGIKNWWNKRAEKLREEIYEYYRD
jgi:hypothetical protein